MIADKLASIASIFGSSNGNQEQGQCEGAERGLPCPRSWEYPAFVVEPLRKLKEPVLCLRCIKARQVREERRRQMQREWAERVLASIAPGKLPNPQQVENLRAYGFGERLNAKLAECGAISLRAEQH